MKKILSVIAGVVAWRIIYIVLMIACANIPGLSTADPTTKTIQLSDTAAFIVFALSVGIVLVGWMSVRSRLQPKVIREEYILDRAGKDKVVQIGEARCEDALDIIYESGMVSASMLQRRLGITYHSAAYIIDKLEAAGIVSAFSNTPRTILVRDVSTAKRLLGKPTTQVDVEAGLLSQIDWMDGHAFEYWCAELLEKVGFINVQVTPGSGDQGVDVLAEKDDIRYAIQCKCYSSDLGNTPIQEVNAGKIFYRCQVGAVMTNRHFTKGAKELAASTGTLLWDRDKLREMTLKAK